MKNSNYRVRLEKFEGPLDLLLHLIEKNELDIYDIPIAEIAAQYLEYINEFRDFDLNTAGEYLVLAATLLAIKAKLLLPSPPQADEEEEDPREELVARLIEYKKYKQAAFYLQDREKLMEDIYVRNINEEEIARDFQPVNPVSNVSLQDLLTRFMDILEKANEILPVYELSSEEIVITECITMVLDLLSIHQGGLSFKELFPGSVSRSRLVMTFLALLELIKQNKIKCRQDQIFGNIQLYLLSE